MSGYVIAVNGLSDLKDIENLDEQIAKAARDAVNKTVDRARSSADREIRRQVNLKASYVKDKLRVTKRASGRDLSAVITGQQQPISLARFAKNRNVQSSLKAGGVSVAVQPGSSKFFKGAFLMNLKNNNLGLAIRLKEGETIKNKKYVKKVGKGLYLLYGPSIDQVFRTVGEEQTAPEAASYLEQEFLRLMALRR